MSSSVVSTPSVMSASESPPGPRRPAWWIAPQRRRSSVQVLQKSLSQLGGEITALDDAGARLLEPSRAVVRRQSLAPLRRRRIKRRKDYGAKAIGQKASFVYLVNQIFGTGVIAIPRVFTLSGWLPCFVANAFVCTAAGFGTLMTLRCMTLVEGNRNFQQRLEYMGVIIRFLHKPYYRLIQAFFYLSIFASNVISIIVVASSFDNILIKCFGASAALSIDRPFRLGFIRDAELDRIYGETGGPADHVVFAVTLGYLLTALCCIPLSLQTMDENMKVQYLSFAVLIATLCGLAANGLLESHYGSSSSFAVLAVMCRYMLFSRGQRQRPPPRPGRQLNALPGAFGQRSYGELMSTFLASYSCVNVIPSWANEMSWDVQVTKVVIQGLAFSCLVYYVFGYCMAYSMPAIESDNILQEVLSTSKHKVLAGMLVYAFDLITVAPGILVYCITTRYNLINEKACQHRGAVFWSSVFPFLIAWLVSDNSHFSALLSWSALVFSLNVNFIAPLLIFLVACSVSPLSHRNPVCQAKKNRVQQTLLTLAGYISSITANRELLELPEPLFDYDDVDEVPLYGPDESLLDNYELQEVMAFRPRRGGVPSSSDSISYDGGAPVAGEPVIDGPLLRVASQTLEESLNPFLPASCRIEEGKLVPASMAQAYVCKIQVPKMTVPLIEPRWDETRIVVDRRNDKKRDRVGGYQLPPKISRLHAWDTVAARRKQMLVEKAVAATTQHPPPVRQAPLALLVRHRDLPQSAVRSPWGGATTTHSKSRWKQQASYARSACGSSYYRVRQYEYEEDELPLTHKSCYEHIGIGGGGSRWPDNNYSTRLNKTLAVGELAAAQNGPLTVSALVSESSAISESEYKLTQSLDTSGPKEVSIVITLPVSPAPGAAHSFTQDLSPRDLTAIGTAVRKRATPSIRLGDKPFDMSEFYRAAPESEAAPKMRPEEFSSTEGSSSLTLPRGSSLTLDLKSLRAPAACLRTPSPQSGSSSVCRRNRWFARKAPSVTRHELRSRPPTITLRSARGAYVPAAGDALMSSANSAGTGYSGTPRNPSPLRMPISPELFAGQDETTTEIVSNAEDAYAQDEDLFGELEEMRIRVFPKGFFRRNHVEVTVTMLMLLVACCFATTLDKCAGLLRG